MKFYTRYKPAPSEGTDFGDEQSMTQSQFKDQCDLNYLIARLQRGDTSVLKSTGVYYDVSNLPTDLQSALQLQIDASHVWENSPVLKARFGVVENMLDFLSRSENREEAIKLGLISAPSGVQSSATPSPTVAEGSTPEVRPSAT